MAAIMATARRRRGQPTQEGRDEAGHDRDVPAADGHDVAQAGRRQVVGHVSGDPIPKADHDARREPGLGLGQDGRQGVAGSATERLDRIVARSASMGIARTSAVAVTPIRAKVGTEAVVALARPRAAPAKAIVSPGATTG